MRSISHDLRTPLTSISGNADTLLHSYDVLDEQTRKQIFTDIYDDAQWLTGLVENLLSITKIVDGSVKLHLLIRSWMTSYRKHSGILTEERQNITSQ